MLRRKGFTLVEIMIVVAIIALLAAIAIPNLLRPRMTANEAAAQATLRTISTATETYASSNNGSYPAGSDLSWATTVTPKYLNEDYTSGSRQGYQYTFSGTTSAYTATAKPCVCGTSGTKSFQIFTGGVLSADGTCASGSCA